MGSVGESAHISPRAPDGGTCDEGGRLRDARAPGARRRGLVVARRPSDLGGLAASPERQRERVDAPPAYFVEDQAEQELWQELRDHDASLNRALNEALRIHSGPAWRVFWVRSCLLRFVILVPLSLLRPHFPWAMLIGLHPLEAGIGGPCHGEIWRPRPDELRASPAPEQRDALDALVEALRTGDGWLAYRAEALRDQLLELEG
jgi:hypothetical protein